MEKMSIEMLDKLCLQVQANTEALEEVKQLVKEIEITMKVLYLRITRND